jgi:hypothetical protein
MLTILIPASNDETEIRMTQRWAAMTVVGGAVLLIAHPRAAARVCDYHVSPVWNDVAAAGQTGTITVDTQRGCAWTASVLTIRTGVWVAVDKTSGTGPGGINYSAAAFPAQWDGSRMRQARIQVRWDAPTLGQDVILTQQGGSCYALFPPGNRPVSSVTFGALAGRGFFDVLADLPFSGAWRMTTDVDWIAMTPPSGILGYGDGAALFTVAANPRLESRSATILGCNGQQFTIHQSGRTAATGHYVPGDFDGDGKADLAIYRPQATGTARWYVLLSGADYRYDAALGIDSDESSGIYARPLTGDLDGDGRSETIVFNLLSQEWWTRHSSDEFRAATAGHSSGSSPVTSVVPIVADFDGSGKGALTEYDPAAGWWNSRALSRRQWGIAGDIPVPADYDGDGIADIAVWRPSEGRWYILDSSSGNTGARSYQWGILGDIPFAGDVDGDGRSDLAVYRPSNGTWYINLSSRGYDPADARSVQWGVNTDVPLTADYDGDGRMDLAVWRPSNGTWYLLFSSSGYAYRFARGIQWGNASSPYFDTPVGRRSPTQALAISATCPGSYHPGDRPTIACLAQVTPGTYPDTTQVSVFADLTSFGLSAFWPLYSCTACGDFGFAMDLSIHETITPGVKTVPVFVFDAQQRRAETTASITITPR